MKVNVFLFDSKAILHGYSRGGAKGDRVETWLLTTNTYLFAHLIDNIQADEALNVLANGGVQQDQASDNNPLKMNAGGSIVPVFPILQSCLSQSVKNTVVFDPFWLADMYATLEAGTSYKNRMRELYLNSQDEEHASWVYDESHLTTLYTHAHRTLCLNPEAEQVVMRYYLASREACADILAFYRQAVQFLPSQLRLELYAYQGKSLPKLEATLQGSGEVDRYYAWSVRFLAIRQGMWWDEADKPRHTITTAEQLVQFCADNPMPYVIDLTKIKRDNTEFLLQWNQVRTQLRSVQSPWVEEQPSYISAQELSELPQKYLVEGIKRTEPTPQSDVYVKPRTYSSMAYKPDTPPTPTGLLQSIGSFFSTSAIFGASEPPPPIKRPQIALKSATKSSITSIEQLSGKAKFAILAGKLNNYIRQMPHNFKSLDDTALILELYNEVKEVKTYGKITDEEAEQLAAMFINLATLMASIYCKNLAKDESAALENLQKLIRIFVSEQPYGSENLFYSVDKDLDQRYVLLENICNEVQQQHAANLNLLHNLQQLFKQLELPERFNEILAKLLVEAQQNHFTPS